MIPPATPDFAGSPTSLTQSPALSYIPQVSITDSTWREATRDSTLSPVSGLVPPEARVAAITARSVTVVSTEQPSVYPATTSLASSSIDPAARRMWASAKLRRSEEHTSELQSRGHLVCR